jgi:thiamine biosynthesis protein ThiS
MLKIKIIINGEEKLVAEGATLSQLTTDLNLDLNKIAIEKDLEIIERSKFDKTILTEGNRIEIVHFIGGG